MTIPIGDRDSSLVPFLQVQRQTELELSRQLTQASNDISRRLASMSKMDSYSAEIRRSQFRLVQQEINRTSSMLWEGPVRDTVAIGKARAVDAAADSVATLTTAYANVPLPAGLEESLRATARQGITNVMSRTVNNVPLSERVYRQGALMSGRIDEIVDNGIISGLSAREIAKDVRAFVNPLTPGGTSYAAMRLGRTELNNAFHTTTIKTWAENPFVEKMQWNLSGSHPRPDECDSYAGRMFKPNEVPAKPHPQCFCYVTPEVMNLDDATKRFANGEFDEWLDERRAAAGQYPETDRQRASALLQRRVYHQGKVRTLLDVSGALRAQYLTKAETDLVRSIMRPARATVKAPAVTVDPLVTTAKHRIDQMVDMGNTEMTNLVRVEMNRQAEIVPRSMSRMGQTKQMTAVEQKMYGGKDTLAYYDGNYVEMHIHKSNFGAKAEATAIKDRRRGWFSQTGEDRSAVDSAIAHEFGHHVEKMINLGSNQVRREVWDEVGSALGVRGPLLTDNGSLMKWVRSNQSATSSVSRYASTHPSEFLAEVWAEYSTNPSARPFVKQIGAKMAQIAERMAT